MIQHRSVAYSLLLLLSLAAAADPLSSNADCPYEPLPTDFNSITYLGFNEEFHIQNTYFYDFESFSRDITFSVKQQSEFRIYIAPHVVDIDIWLYDTKQSSSLKHTFDIGGDEVITYTLPAGDYRIRLLFFGIYYISGVSCPTINMEVSIVPSARLASRVASYACPSSELAPSIDLASLGRQDKFYYNSDMNSSAIYNVRNNQSSGEVAENTYRFVTSYKFSLTGAANADAYSFTARIGTNFLIGGSLGLLLQSQADPTPTDLSCLSSQNCSMGVHVSQNENTLSTVLAPGDYVLWLFDSLFEKNSSLSKCIPYSMEIDVRHAEQIAGFLNCPGSLLPPLLNVPGIFDDDGFMYYRQDVLVDLSEQQASSVFKVSTPSVFRAYTSDHRLDIDLKLMNKDTGRVVVSTYRWFGEEGLITPLEANVNYEFVVVFFGRYEKLFCETFLLELAVAPISSFSNVNSTTCRMPENTPSLSDMSASLLTTPYTYSLSNATYLFDYKNDYSQRTIVSQSFTITTSSTLKINLGSNFLLGDIRFTVTAIRGGDELNSTMIGRHMRNNHFFAELLTPGQYQLTIATGVSQATSQPGGFPSCSAYTLSIEVAPTTSTSTSCIQARSFPKSFNTPEFLGTSSNVHIQETFLMPLSLSTRLSATEEAYFTVDEISFFRLYLEPNHIDIDVVLYENGTQVASETSFNDEEAIAWVAKPATSYRILLRYYHWFFGNHDNDAPCYFSAIEMAISPMSSYGGTFCTEDTQPPAPLFATVNKTETVTQGTFHFSQERDPKKITIPFTIPTGSALFRAVISYDFIWNDLALVLYNNVSGRLSQITAGSVDYNQNEITTRLLPAGQYALQIYEPFPTTMTGQFALRNCVDYVLQTAIQIVDGSSINPNQVCAGVSFPPATLDSIAYLSNLTDNSVHISREILVDVSSQTDAFQFTVITPSVFRMHVPAHSSVDVDLYLRRGTIASPGELLDSQFSYGEEIIYRQLQPGQYMVKLYYYGFGQQLPSSEECPSYFATIALYPLSYYQAIPALAQPCSGTGDSVPSQLVGGQPFNGTFHHSLESPHWSTSVSFTTTEVSQLVTNLRYDDASGGLSLRLDGSITDGSVQVNKSYSALYEKNHAYLNEVLRPGTYTIVIYDPSTAIAVPTLLCSTFGLDYLLNTTTTVLPNVCSDLQTLPTDLSTSSGGSAPYGGPQAADGSIQMFGYKFYMSKDPSKKHNYIKFMVPSEPLYVRVYASSDSSNDIDFYLYRNASDLVNSLYKSSIGWDSTENAIWTLPPQPNPYLLDVSFYKVNSAIDCNYFHFELVAKTNSTIRQELLCPVPLPSEVEQVPPESIRFLAGEDYTVYNQNYVFTSERVNLNTVLGQFRYRMTLRAETNVTLTARLGYDFLANDYQLILRDSQSRIVLQGVADGADSRNSYIDFYNELEASLSPGTYYLDIVESVFAKNWGLSNFCHYFSFQLTGASVGPATPPHIVSVSPASGSDLDPTAPLVLTIEFSNRLNGSISTQYITSSNAAFLSSYGSGRVYPTYATVDTSSRNLELTFNGPFVDGGLYSLSLDASKFTTMNGSVFGPEEGYARAHYYTMHSCFCSGRGHCERTSSNWKCICDDPWAGDDCSKCKPGTHAAADTCVADQKCSPTSCNNHGYCDDSTGFISCYCHYGFDSANDSFCNVCAVGFENYPNCTAISNIDRGTSCTAPLIPTDLNGLAFLGFDGNMHIQGYYYVDLNVAFHDTVFTLKQDSVFRAHAEPTWVDIDMWLYRILADGSEEIVQFNFAFNYVEETIFQTLSAGKYRLRFKYFDWSTGRDGDCETFNLELAIHTLTATRKEVNDLKPKCTQSSQLPSISKLGNISSAYSYTMPANSYFTINDFSNSTAPNYVHNISFVIAATGSQVAVLEANIASRFTWGSVALLLEQGAKGTHCDNTGFTWGQSGNPGCAYGDNYLNHNHLRQTLRNGMYTLWIYEPTRQNNTISTCAAFEFSLSIDFVDDTSDVYTCRGSFLPSSLESSVYTSRDGFVHLSDEYLLVDEHSNITFSVAQTSLFRVGTQGNAGILLALTNADTGAGIDAGTHTNEDPTLFAEIPAGKYRLLLGITGGQTCPSVFLELAIEPVLATIVPAACSTLSTDILPEIATPLQMPYDFPHITRAYYTRNSDNNLNVAAYSFYLSSAANLHTSVSSDFLRSDLRVHVYMDNRLLAVGKRDYNHDDLRIRLEAGNYTVKIVRPPLGVTNRFIPSCSQFNFELSVRYVSSSSDVLCQGTTMPTSLNTMRFLGLENRFAYQSSSFLIPVSSRIYEFKSTSLVVANNSLIRIYAEQNSVDIDVKIIQDSTYRVVAQGSNGIGGEEALSFVLQAGVNYTLQLQYWFWTQVTEPCPTFSLGFAAGPVVPLTKTCPNNGASHWPDLPATTPSTYSYSSVDKGEHLYFQESITALATKTYTLRFTNAVNFHAELGFDFLYGSIVLKLKSVSAGTIYYGIIEPNKHSLTQMNLPAGEYELTIYQPVANVVEVMGCVDFTFEILIEPYTTFVGSVNRAHVPSTLDSLAYLALEPSTHIQGTYTMFDGLHRDSISFSVPSTSLLRVEAIAAFEESASVLQRSLIAPLVTLKGPSSDSGFGFLLHTINAGTYTLEFGATQPMGDPPGGVPIALEMAVRTVTALQADLTTYNALYPDTCQDSVIQPINLSPTGYYSYHSDAVSVSYNTITTKDANTPLFVLPFKVNLESRLFAQIGFDFLLDELYLVLRSVGGVSDIEIYGRGFKNLNELNQIVPAGSYELSIFQPVKFDAPADLKHCAEFSFSLTIQDASLGNHVDCSSLDVVPWELNSAAGPSVAFGGPIDSSGYLHLYSNSLLMSAGRRDTISFTVPNDVIISLYAASPQGDSVVDLVLSSNNVTQQPLFNSLGYNQERLALFSVSRGAYSLELVYRGSTSGTACPNLELLINMRSRVALSKEVACPSSSYTSMLPEPVQFQQDFSCQYVESLFPSAVYNTNTFPYTLKFTAPARGRFQARLSFNSLISYFDIKLSSSYTYGSGTPFTYNVASGAFQAQSQRSGSTTITETLSAYLYEGQNYTLTISVPTSFAASAPLGAYNNTCMPFLWSSLFVPETSPRPFVSNVLPSSAFDLDPNDNFTVLIQLSKTVYSGVPLAPIRRTDGAIIALSFYLEGNDASVHHPDMAISVSANALDWNLVFFGSNMKSASTYTLKLAPNKLSDNGTSPLWFGCGYDYYTVDLTCKNHGHYSVEESRCICDIGYAGVACDVCDVGYSDSTRGSGSSSLNCVLSTNGCTVNTCNSYEGNPLGVCKTDANGMAVCYCDPIYSGSRCEHCAANRSASTWPRCELHIQCPTCAHGEDCDFSTGKCRCEQMYAGDACDTCAPDWSGKDCQEHNSGGHWDATTAFLEIAGIILFVGAVSAGIVWYFKKRRAGGSRYKSLPRFDEDDDGGTSFPAFDNTLMDDDEPDEGSLPHTPLTALARPAPGPLSLNSDGNPPKSRPLMDL